MNNLFKKLLFMLLLMLSPMVMLAMFGSIYIAVRLLAGIELMAALSSFKALILSLMPYFPYLTIIPAALLIIALFIRSKFKLESSRK